MITLDLFEQDPNFRKPVEYENRKQYGTVNLANFIKAYQNNQPVQFDFPGGKSYKLTAQWVDMLAEYYNTLETNNDKAQLVYDVLTDYNKTIRLLNELAQSKLFEKKSSKKTDNPEFKSTKLARLKTQARAKYPAAGSDLEAITADFVDSQEDDQREFQQVNATNKKQDELLKQITAINQQQDQEIDSLDSDRNELQKNLQQIRAVNAELAKKLTAMAVRKPKEKEKTTATVPATATATAPTTTDGSWIPPSAADTRPDWTTVAPALAQPGISTATPAMVGGEPATVLAKPKRKRRTRAEIDAEKASKATMAAMTKMAGGAKIKPVQPNIPAAPTVGEPTAIPKTINLFPGVTDTEKSVTPQTSTSGVSKSDNVVDLFPEKLQRQAAESITEADTIPLKSVVQGYNVEYNPRTRQVSVSRGGQVIGTAINKSNNASHHLTLINRIIDRAEEDKYPTDIEIRDVALPMKKMAEGKQPREYTGEELDQMVAFLSQQMGASVKEIRRMYVDPMIQRGEIKLVDKKSMRAKELEESLRSGESYSAKIYFKDGTSATLTGIPSLEIDLKQYFAKKGRAVDRVEYDFAPQGGGRGTGPERHEPGSGSAVSARTGEALPEADELSVTGQPIKQEKGYYAIWAKKGDRWTPVTKYPTRKEAEEIKRGLEKRGMEVIIREGDVVNVNRGGYNAFRDRADWLDKRDFVQRQLLDPRQRDNYPELKQRLLDINDVGRKLGYTT